MIKVYVLIMETSNSDAVLGIYSSLSNASRAYHKRYPRNKHLQIEELSLDDAEAEGGIEVEPLSPDQIIDL